MTPPPPKNGGVAYGNRCARSKTKNPPTEVSGLGVVLYYAPARSILIERTGDSNEIKEIQLLFEIHFEDWLTAFFVTKVDNIISDMVDELL